jgi:hypothetical protein
MIEDFCIRSPSDDPMSTVHAPPPRPAIHPEVVHPLDSLRGTIRRYVVLEGLLTAVVFVAAWFAAGLVLDFGVFKLFTWDWVQDAPGWVRAAALGVAGVLLLAILVKRIVFRLTRELSYPALALVLERRFPQQLGDRLITAVELADVPSTARLGYSAEMIRQTIDEARDRVKAVPVRQVFNWRRLWVLAGLSAAVLLGVAAVGYAASAVAGVTAADRFGWKFAHTVGIFAERNVLLRDTPWPRRAHLELVGYPDDGLKVARDAAPPRVKARAFRWVVADPTTRDGWRPMRWSEVKDYADAGKMADRPFRQFYTIDGIPTSISGEWLVDDVEARQVALERKVADGRKVLDYLRKETPRLEAEGRIRMGKDGYLEVPDGPLAESLLTEGRLLRSVRGLAIGWATVAGLFDGPPPAGQIGTERRVLHATRTFVPGFLGVWVLPLGPETANWRPMYAKDVERVFKGRPNMPAPPETLTTVLAEGSFFGRVSVSGSEREYDVVEPVPSGTLPMIEPNNHKLGSMADELTALRKLLDDLAAVADRPSMGRKLRHLDVPQGVTLAYTGTRTAGGGNMSAERGNEFGGEVVGMTESVEFVVKAEDYRTPPRPITLVSTPLLTRLARTEYQPAYLHHAPPQGEDYPGLRHLRQRLPDKDAALTGDRTVFAVPTGTELEVRGTADKPLRQAFLKPKVGLLPGAKKGSADPVPIPVTADRTGFAFDLKGDFRLTSNLEFDIEFVDEDGIRSRRPVLIQVTEDQGPTVELGVEVIRKVGPVYLVTPKCRIPFNPGSNVRDDNGLSKVVYAYKIVPDEAESGRTVRPEAVASALVAPAPVSLPTTMVPLWHTRTLFRGEGQTGMFGVARFDDRRKGLKSETRAVLEKQLREPFAATPDLVKRVEFKDGSSDFFDLAQLRVWDRRKNAEVPLAVSPGEDIQPRFYVELNVEATDTNYETGPKVGRNPEPIRLRVVPEADLLAEIGKEEELIANRLREAVDKLAAAKVKLAFVRQKNAKVEDKDRDVVRVRAQDAVMDVNKARDLVLGIIRDYRRITRECEVNRVTEDTTLDYAGQANQIDRVMGKNLPGPVYPAPEYPEGTDRDTRTERTGRLRRPQGTFTDVQGLLGLVVEKLVAGQWADADAVRGAEEQTDLLIAELGKLGEAYRERLSYDRLVKEFEKLVESADLQRSLLTRWRETGEGRLLSKDPILGPLGQQLLIKGETKKFRHAIDWRQYEEDKLVVKVAVSDAEGLVAAEEIALDFEKNQTHFEYEVRAMKKAGDFTVTLTPEVGKPIKVRVTVK